MILVIELKNGDVLRFADAHFEYGPLNVFTVFLKDGGTVSIDVECIKDEGIGYERFN